jgi:hypothetical protein
MKKLIFIVLSLCVLTQVWASGENYQKAMKKNLQALQEAKSKDALQEVANTFERIASKEKQEWLPLYYIAYTYITISWMEKEAVAKDAVLDKARPYVEQALALASNESEVVLLNGYWNMAKLSIDPASRGQSLSPLAMQIFGKAMQLNPENPRAYLMMAHMEFGMAKFFGSSTEKACNMAKRSVELFGKITPGNELLPGWGKEQAIAVSNSCQQN